MANARFKLETPVNEPVYEYRPGSPERRAIEARLAAMRSERIEIPLIIGGKEVRTGVLGECRMPHAHGHVLAVYHQAGAKEVALAVDAARDARRQWASMAWEDRAAVFLKAAQLLAGPMRDTLNAATMLCQSKNVFQAEIDAACELIDFLRFNCAFATQLYQDQPYSPAGVWNRMEYRPLEGFVFAVSPFNFTSIGGNLSTAPAIMGCVTLWKPASTAVFSSYHVMKILEAAGLPPGVINFIPGRGAELGDMVLASPELAGVHFTGSTDVFQGMWRTIGARIGAYRSYPRIVGETGGKDFIVAHASADDAELVTALLRGAFEYQGQKCSAVSRAYVPESLWRRIREPLCAGVREMRMGSPEDFSCFMNAVIDGPAFRRIKSAIDEARHTPDAELIAGGACDDRAGYFIAPTIIQARRPDYRTMVDELFGPVLTVYVYPDGEFAQALALCDATSPYALTGAIFARDRSAVVQASAALRDAAGNFYINDKPTGAVVGQQPFGGARASGTNDKAGSLWNLIRWVSPRAIKEAFAPARDYRYPFME